MAGAGTTTDGLFFGGNNPSTTNTVEAWDGTSYTEVADMASGRDGMGQAGTASSAIGASGSPKTVSTEEWDKSVAGSNWDTT